MSLRVATYNVRFAEPEGPHNWPSRRRALIDHINELDADIVATQEGLDIQLDELAMASGFRRVGQGRRGGPLGEHSAILYDPRRFTLTAHRDLWVSHNPTHIGSKHPRAALPRIVTLVDLRNQDGCQFTVVNTHLSHMSPSARSHGARMIREIVEQLPAEQPVVVTGDFNAPPASPPHQILTYQSRMTDSWDLADKRMGATYGTYHAFAGAQGGPRIDWILVSRTVQVATVAIVPPAPRRPMPSDHLPVTADVTIPCSGLTAD